MGITSALAGLATIVGIGAVAVHGPAPATLVLSSQPAVASASPATAPPPPASAPAAGVTAPAASGSGQPGSAAPAAAAAPATVATSAGGTTAPGAAPTTPTPTPRCDDGAWRGPNGINVEGRPENLDPGNRGAVYLWHGSDGWHLRTTDATNTAHHYTGTIALSAGARFTAFSTVRLEHEDRVWVDGDNVLHYDFTTYAAIDGVDFTVSACDGARDREVMHLTMDYNGHEDDPARIALGDRKQHPDSPTFQVTRRV